MPLIAYVDPDAKAAPTLAGDADEIRWIGRQRRHGWEALVNPNAQE